MIIGPTWKGEGRSWLFYITQTPELTVTCSYTFHTLFNNSWGTHPVFPRILISWSQWVLNIAYYLPAGVHFPIKERENILYVPLCIYILRWKRQGSNDKESFLVLADGKKRHFNWINDSPVKSKCYYSCRWPRLHSQNPHDGSQPSAEE